MLARSVLRRQAVAFSKNASAGFSTSIARRAGNLSAAQDQVSVILTLGCQLLMSFVLIAPKSNFSRLRSCYLKYSREG
jgi:hypothetical protein